MNDEKVSDVSASSSSSDDMESSEDEQDFAKINDRAKRHVGWCSPENLDSQSSQDHNNRKIVIWPPPSVASTAAVRTSVRLRNVNFGNPKLGGKMQLYCRTGHHLAVYPDGKVRGNSDENDLHTYLEISSAGYPGQVKIRGLLCNLYVGMDKKGRLYGEVEPTSDAIIFIESFRNQYNTYLSRKHAHLGWYIGLKKNGKMKRGPKTGFHQKAVQFLPRRNRFQ
ncbi:unnamed protein product [Acanthoscelides obtectus]|uniref:Fibroblast growth factor n=1 Tax=Acanthoscelides obtectus TaxID=200917 RepID=A0A9P0PR22_ACAOB|nr:unnamed protein product [Acanthoscelides obtectus]CAK1664191.1 Fibroblast growth factor 1 [Acanthoscelides obtectus]